MGLPLVLPDVNASEYRFTVNERGEIVYGLGAIKGIGEGPVESIVAARTGEGPFRDLFDFCRRTDARKVNKRAVEALIRAGAMDSLGAPRPVLMAAMNEAIKAAEQQAHAADVGLLDMFGGALSEADGDAYADFRRARPWSTRERLRGEKETLGLYITGHPIDDHEAEIAQFVRTRIAQLRADAEPQRIAGLVVGMRTIKNRRGDDIAFVQLDDRSARIEVALFAECYGSCREHVVKDTILVVEGVVANDDVTGELRMRASSAYTLTEARRRFARELVLRLDAGDFTSGLPDVLERLLGCGEAAEQGCMVRVIYTAHEARAELILGPRWRVAPEEDAIARLREQFGAARVELRYG